jgi:Xaa-Pro aminopeptidase
MTFHNIFSTFHPKIQEALETLGFTKPTEPQERSFPHIMDGKHTLLIAPTGSGKTESAVLPVFDSILKSIKPGVTETEISAEMEYTMKKLGAKGPSFETIIAAGKRSAMCHGTATDHPLQKGDAVVLDFGVIYRNYCSDMTRTIFIGEPDGELKKIYGIVLKAQLAALDCLVSGLRAYDADKVARDIITEAGYGTNFGHSLGHGVGVEIHEEPRLSSKSEDILQDGMVFSVEPGIYVEGLGGVRIEDMVVLTGGRPRNFTTSTKELIII